MNFYTADVVQTYPVSLNLEKDFPQTGHHWLYIFRPDIGIELLPVLAVVAESQEAAEECVIDAMERADIFIADYKARKAFAELNAQDKVYLDRCVALLDAQRKWNMYEVERYPAWEVAVCGKV